jgi:hypothetical protein
LIAAFNVEDIMLLQELGNISAVSPYVHIRQQTFDQCESTAPAECSGSARHGVLKKGRGLDADVDLEPSTTPSRATNGTCVLQDETQRGRTMEGTHCVPLPWRGRPHQVTSMGLLQTAISKHRLLTSHRSRR